MAHYIFTASAPEFADVAAREIIANRLAKGVWPLTSKTRLIDQLRTDDKILFYAAGRDDPDQSKVLAKGRLASRTKKSNRIIDRSREWLGVVTPTRYCVELKDTEWLESEVSVRAYRTELEFITNEQHWGLHMMGGVTRITSDDYHCLIQNST